MYRIPQRIGIALIAWWSLRLATDFSSVAMALSLETASNPVRVGTIAVDASRTDWEGLAPYSPDTDSIPPGPELDFAVITWAHDTSHLYLRWEMNPSPSGTDQFFGFRHNLLIDTDQNRDTGFIGSGGFIAIGADVLVQGNAAYRFTGPDAQTWGWTEIQGGLLYDDFPTTDIELSIPLTVLNRPAAVDFVLNGANSNFATEDYYPQFATAGALGDYFSYEFSSQIPGDLNADGSVDASDAGIMFENWGLLGPGNLNGDDVVDAADAGIMFANWTGDSLASVPEPPTFGMVGGLLGAIGLWRRRSA